MMKKLAQPMYVAANGKKSQRRRRDRGAYGIAELLLILVGMAIVVGAFMTQASTSIKTPTATAIGTTLNTQVTGR